ncbi:MAG: type II secretion system protein [Planctomycetota bacterium]|jgi:prepilin-type N-terminal cleavage/methylation domain-containing protein
MKNAHTVGTIALGKRNCTFITHKPGFTLIELLVVIAIIALLMGILMPALRRAKELTREIVCKSHLQQWSLCMEMYTSEHDGKFMPGIDEDWATGQFSWIYTLIPYYNDADIRLCPKAKRTTVVQGRQLRNQLVGQ